MRCAVLTQHLVLRARELAEDQGKVAFPIPLCTRYAKSGTDISACYALSGTDFQ